MQDKKSYQLYALCVNIQSQGGHYVGYLGAFDTFAEVCKAQFVYSFRASLDSNPFHDEWEDGFFSERDFVTIPTDKTDIETLHRLLNSEWANCAKTQTQLEHYNKWGVYVLSVPYSLHNEDDKDSPLTGAQSCFLRLFGFTGHYTLNNYDDFDKTNRTAQFELKRAKVSCESNSFGNVLESRFEKGCIMNLCKGSLALPLFVLEPNSLVWDFHRCFYVALSKILEPLVPKEELKNKTFELTKDKLDELLGACHLEFKLISDKEWFFASREPIIKNLLSQYTFSL